MLYYCCGCGTACSSTMISPFQCMNKCCCCRCSLGPGVPWDGDGCCMYLQSCGPCQGQCRLPPKKEANPMCGLCGWSLDKCLHARRSGNSPAQGRDIVASQKPNQ